MILKLVGLLFLLIASSAAHTLGTVTVDTFTFDRIRETFDIVLAKFDDKFPFGEKYDQFKQLALDVANSKGLIIAEIPVVDYGDKENEALAQQYGVKKEDFPAYKLFIKGKSEPISYTGDQTNQDLKQFLSDNTNVWFGLPGTIEEFDHLAQKFFIAASNKDESEQSSILEKASEQAKALTEAKEQKSGEWYIKVMSTIVKQGVDYLAREKRRLDNLLKGKLTNEKKNELQQRANVLRSFKQSKNSKSDATQTKIDVDKDL